MARAAGSRRGGCVCAALLALAAPSCTTPETALVIRIDSDLRRGAELASVHVVATPDGADPALDRDYDLTSTDLPLPGTIVLEATSSNDDRALAVTVTGSLAGSGGSIERDYTVHFEPGRVVVLDVFLARRCAQPGGFACDPATMATCGPCDCDPIDPGALPDYSRSMSTTPYCYTNDAGGAPPPDAAPEDDGGTDAAPACTPTPEVCNGLDDDCNGLVDDGLGYQSCGTGACRATAPSCENGAPATCTPAAPRPERCNGLDDDCNGQADDGSPCGAGRICGRSDTLAGNPWLCCTLIDPGFCPSRCVVCEQVNHDPSTNACCVYPTQ